MSKMIKKCPQCGATLPKGAQGLCSICKHEQRELSSRKSTVRKMAIIAVALSIVFIVLGTASVSLYKKYNAELFIENLVNALEQKDTETLSGLIVSDTLTASQNDLLVLCSSFEDENARNALSEQLLQQMANSNAQRTYPALSLSKERAFMGYYRYQLSVQGVQLLLTTNAQNPLLLMNDVSHTGEVGTDGILYKDLFPGRYVCSVTGSSQTGVTLTGTPTILDLFSVDTPNLFDGALPIADITVSGCPSDEAEIIVDGITVSQKPSAGIVSLPQVVLNSVISVRYTHPHGAVTTGSVSFSDLSNTTLSFENLVTEGGVPAKTDIDTLLRSYYASYLDAINNQDATRFNGITPTLAQQLTESLGSAENLASVFEFTDAACEEPSIVQRNVGELPGFVCNASFAYKTSNRESHEEAEITLQLTVEVAFSEGAWRVNRFAACTPEDYAANATTSLPQI